MSSNHLSDTRRVPTPDTDGTLVRRVRREVLSLDNDPRRSTGSPRRYPSTRGIPRRSVPVPCPHDLGGKDGFRSKEIVRQKRDPES